MKKIYSLMLLGALLLLGVQNVWGDVTYYVGHNENLNSDTWTKTNNQMTESDGVFSIKYTTSVQAGKVLFKIISNDGSNDAWINPNEADLLQSSSNVTLSRESDGIGGYNISFDLPLATDVTISYNPTNNKVFVQADYRDVTLYVTSNNTDRNLYAYYCVGNTNYEVYGAWPGKNSSNTKETIGGMSFFKHVIRIPKGGNGKPLYIIFNSNGTNNDSYKSLDIPVGTITNDTTVYYSLDGNCRLAYVVNSSNGSTWDWTIMPNLNAVVSLANTKNYAQVVFGGQKYYSSKWNDEHAWNGGSKSGSNPVSLAANTTTDLVSSGYNYQLQDMASGTAKYVFSVSWGDSKAHVTVTYPGSYTRTGLTEGNWGTICLPYAVNAGDYTGAKLYSIVGYTKDAQDKPYKLVVESVADDEALVAGRPYIFKATDNTFTATYTGDPVADPGNYNGLYGSYAKFWFSNVSGNIANTYIISSNQVAKASASYGINEHRAYIEMTAVPDYNGEAPDDAPGRRFELPLSPNTTTALDNIDAGVEVVKFVENGKLFIMKNGVVYDMTGRAVR